jgi:hypothetical protein
MKTRIPAKPNTRHQLNKVASHSKALKTLHRRYRKNGGDLGLKQFVKTSDNDDVQLLGVDWLHNKKANFSKPPMGLGSTRKRGGKQAKPVKAKTNE